MRDETSPAPATGTNAAPGAACAPAPAASTAPGARRRLRAEVWIVLGLSLGQSAVYALVNIYARFTAETPLREQATALNPSRSPRPYLDLAYQVLSLGFALVPVLLALFLLTEPGRRATARIGLSTRRPWRELAVGVGLAALIGLPGLAFYAAGRALGITVEVQAATLADYWWTVPVLLLSALKNGLLEEVIAVGYLTERLEQLGWRPAAVVGASALLRGLYHLYQGPGPFLGNVVMGVVFAEYYRRRRRTFPLVVAHTLLDVVAFVGYSLLPATLLRSLGVS
ncbi:CPBP family intramembrane glutamic endopeptidase [Georgenia wangjunii]|uniref:CPBP family intramembrane glutamic endopeptidase n=1 Tax=Georgenia wangjunii TaxID=3117730 RepID=UPI002F260B84